MYWVYILKSSSGRYYIGSAADVEERLKKHNNGGSVWTKPYRPWTLIHVEKFETKSEALKREKQIKAYKGGEAFKKLLNI